MKKRIAHKPTLTKGPHQRLLDIAAQADTAEGIRQGLKDVKNGRVRPAREVLEAFRRSRGIPKP
jgi:predicted transcriptional regulator